MNRTKEEPNQKNSSFDDETVIAIEEAGAEVVRRKLGRNDREVVKASLGGSVGKKLDVVVEFTGFLTNSHEPVETEIGTGRIETVYDDGRVSVRFHESAVKSVSTEEITRRVNKSIDPNFPDDAGRLS